MNAKLVRAITLLLGVCLLLAGMSTFPTSVQAHSKESSSQAIDAYVASRMEAAHIPGLSLAVVKGDQIAYLKGYGDADPSGHPVTPQTPFIIGSISKTFTALALMQLVEAGKVDVDAPVQRYLPWFSLADSHASARITVRNLLNQTSGIPQLQDTMLWTDLDGGALERAVRSMKTAELSRPIGTFGYSNANYQILGLIVQHVSGESYEDYVRQHIFTPLDMRTSFASQDEAQQHGMASGYHWWFGFPVPAPLPFNRAQVPAGYLISSAQDMAHYLIAQMNGGYYQDRSVLSPAGIAFLHTPSAKGEYGIGWETAHLNGRTLMNHDGGVANFQTSLFFDPKERVGVYIAANVMNALDAFSSPPGSVVLDGITARALAESVLSLTTNQPLPDQGAGIERLSLIFDLIVLALTALLIVSLARIHRRYHRLAQRKIDQRSDLVWRSSLIAASHFIWPAVVLYLTLGLPDWKMLLLFQPDAGYWLLAVGAVVFLKGCLELALLWRVFSQSHQSQTLQPA